MCQIYLHVNTFYPFVFLYVHPTPTPAPSPPPPPPLKRWRDGGRENGYVLRYVVLRKRLALQRSSEMTGAKWKRAVSVQHYFHVSTVYLLALSARRPTCPTDRFRTDFHNLLANNFHWTDRHPHSCQSTACKCMVHKGWRGCGEEGGGRQGVGGRGERMDELVE